MHTDLLLLGRNLHLSTLSANIKSSNRLFHHLLRFTFHLLLSPKQHCHCCRTRLFLNKNRELESALGRTVARKGRNCSRPPALRWCGRGDVSNSSQECERAVPGAVAFFSCLPPDSSYCQRARCATAMRCACGGGGEKVITAHMEAK